MTNVRRQPGRSPDGEIYVFGEDQGVLDSAVAALGFEFGPAKVRGTSDQGEAGDWLRDGHPAALVTSVGGAAKLICTARSRHKRLPIILLTERGVELSGVSIGNTRILSRHFRDHELPQAIDQLLPGRSTPRLGSANPSEPLAELLQLLTHVGYGGTLRVTSTDAPHWGRIGLRGGRAIHAQVGDQTGAEALLEMAEWRGFDFSWSDEEPDAVNVNVSCSDIAKFLAEANSEELTDDVERMLARSERTHDDNSKLTPYPMTPAQGAGNANTEAQLLSDGDDVSDEQADPDAPLTPNFDNGEQSMANNINETLEELSAIDGFIAAAIVDADSGMSLGTQGGNSDFDVDVAAATNTDVVQAKMRAVRKLELEDAIEDILITLDGQYHLIRPLDDRPNIFFYLALNREKSNLAMARMTVADAGKTIEL